MWHSNQCHVHSSRTKDVFSETTHPKDPLCKVWRLNSKRNREKPEFENSTLQNRTVSSRVAYRIIVRRQHHVTGGSANGGRKKRAKTVSPSLSEEKAFTSRFAARRRQIQTGIVVIPELL